MSTLGQFPKPEAGQYQGRRKLFLVPTFLFSAELPDEGQQLLDRYWSEVRDHVQNLERSLGSVSHVFHESLYVDGDAGMRLLEAVNPRGCSFIQAMCQSTARLEATEDRALVEESMDWQRCMSVGLLSEKVRSTAQEGYQEATAKRYEHIAARLDDTLKENEAGALFIGEDHRVQFPSDIQVFYVAPPSLDALKRWLEDQWRAAMQAASRPPEPPAEEPEPETPEQPPQPEPEKEGPS